jgi:hypothetical protein
MSEGEAFVIQAYTDIVRSSLPTTRRPSPDRDGRRGAGEIARSLIDVTVTLAAITILVLMVAIAGVTLTGDADAAAPASETTTSGPDALTTCEEVSGGMVCVREAT